MFDTMTLTKTVGALCGSLLILLFGSWAAEAIYHGGGGHGDDHHQQAYVIDTGEEEAGAAEEEAGPDFAELFVNADTGKGERVFNKCKACHSLEEGDNRVGPYLHGVVGRTVDAVDGFAYSGSLEAAAEVWTPENLNEFLTKPSAFAPGTIMSFAGLKSIEDRANLIAFLDQTDGDTYQMDAATSDTTEEPAAEEASAEEPAAEETPAEEATEESIADEPAEEAETPAATEEAEAEEPAAEEAAAEEPAAEEAASGFAAMVAAADPADGEKVYRQCKACHVADAETNRVGPHLVGVVGREVAAVEGFSYSDALTGLGGEWTLERLDAWLEKPRDFAPGNKMTFSGLRKEEQRASVIAYLQSLAE